MPTYRVRAASGDRSVFREFSTKKEALAFASAFESESAPAEHHPKDHRGLFSGKTVEPFIHVEKAYRNSYAPESILRRSAEWVGDWKKAMRWLP